ncbi:MAG TPA: cupin domain-containing protein [Nitrospirales bacterium]|nr:cupin domain-containing protein [Nitrospiraceae bacterium]HNP30464.1 cupin domain-containing protein [Nitrospirales bacterium]
MESYSIIDRSTVAKDWHARGFSCGVWIDHAGREWRDTIPEMDEMFMVMSGELELEIAGERIQPSVGEEIHIPSGSPYTIRNIGGTTARWLYGQKRTPSAPLQPINSFRIRIHSPL